MTTEAQRAQQATILSEMVDSMQDFAAQGIAALVITEQRLSALLAGVEALRQQQDQALEIARLEHAFDEVAAQRNTAESELVVLRDALKALRASPSGLAAYVAHKDHCDQPYGDPCSCGLDALLKSAEGKS